MEEEEKKAEIQPRENPNEFAGHLYRSYTRKKDRVDTSPHVSIYKRFPNILTSKKFSRSELTLEQK